MKILKTKISKKYLAAAWAYRRAAKVHMPTADFSLNRLEELYNYETYGKGSPDKLSNGYLYGKWLMDLSVAMWRQDHGLGDVTKYELLKGCPSHYRSVVRSFPAREFFGYEKYFQK